MTGSDLQQHPGHEWLVVWRTELFSHLSFACILRTSMLLLSTFPVLLNPLVLWPQLIGNLETNSSCNTGAPEQRGYENLPPKTWMRTVIKSKFQTHELLSLGNANMGCSSTKQQQNLETGFFFHKKDVTVYLSTTNKQTNSMAWVRERTIPTERPPLVGEVIANFCG
jgi:hypothetical protein